MKTFSPRRWLSPIFVLVVLGLGLSEARSQTTLLSNLPTNNGGDGPTTNTEVRAVTFKTGADDFEVTSVTMQLLNYYSANPDVPLLSFHLSSNSNVGSSAGSNPGAQVGATLTAPASSSGTSAPFAFAPVGTLTLSANTWYWLVMAGTSSTNPFEWVRSDPSVTPTGSVGATFGNQMINYNSGAEGDWEVGNNGPHSFAIQGNTVPEPRTMALLLVVGLGVMVFGRQRRLSAKR